jgi:hypothetical protein
MGLQLKFADSFAHYNDTSLKWSSGGGAFETNLAHVRTGPQSLRIQAGNAPSILNFNFPADALAFAIQPFASFTLGFAWQTQSLAGEIMVELWDIANLAPSPAERQFFLVQNANGSISVRTGSGLGTVIGTTAAGVLTIGPWWYIELTVDMNGATLVLTVTDAANLAVVALNVSGFATSQGIIDSLLWGGPSGANSAWIADFYFAFWDTLAPSTLGAPKIYGLPVPITPDGFGRLNNAPDASPFNVSAPPYFSQVNTIPQNTGVFIAREDVAGFFPFTIGQGFVYDVSQIPGGSVVAAVQACHLWSMGHDTDGNVPAPSPFMGYTGGGIGDFAFGSLKAGLVDSPFLYVPFPFDQNPVSAAPWVLAEFSGPTAFQVGPGVQSQG